MPLIPPHADSPTVFPDPHSADLQRAIESAEETWNRFYPYIAYSCIMKATTEVATMDTLSGEDGTTKFDPLWGEAVPTAVGPMWQQPQLNENANVVPADAAVYAEPIQIRARIQRTAREEMLKRVGFDLVRSLLLTIPNSLLDKNGIIPRAGDRFAWDGDLYEILQTSPYGWWMNTNTVLYTVMNAQHLHRGA